MLLKMVTNIMNYTYLKGYTLKLNCMSATLPFFLVLCQLILNYKMKWVSENENANTNCEYARAIQKKNLIQKCISKKKLAKMENWKSCTIYVAFLRDFILSNVSVFAFSFSCAQWANVQWAFAMLTCFMRNRFELVRCTKNWIIRSKERKFSKNPDRTKPLQHLVKI